jgi:hypothetical protein
MQRTNVEKYQVAVIEIKYSTGTIIANSIQLEVHVNDAHSVEAFDGGTEPSERWRHVSGQRHDAPGVT